jgi:DNA polymerase III subunit chi
MQIDFYILKEDSPKDINQLICLLCEKALTQKSNVLLYTQSIEQAHQIDDLLWTYKADSFIAHKNELDEAVTDDTFNYPVIICSSIESDEETVSISHADELLINLSNETPPFFYQFGRLLEVVGKIKNDKDAARNRYRFYRKKGYTSNIHDL